MPHTDLTTAFAQHGIAANVVALMLQQATVWIDGTRATHQLAPVAPGQVIDYTLPGGAARHRITVPRPEIPELTPEPLLH